MIFLTDSMPAAELSPLDQIRLAEAEITRKIVTARETAAQARAAARARAALLKKQAQESGTREGQNRYKELVSKAEENARAIVEHAHNQAAELQEQGRARMELAVQDATGVVLGLRAGGRSDES